MVPFWVPKYEVPYYNRDPKRDHNFDNHPYVYSSKDFMGLDSGLDSGVHGDYTVHTAHCSAHRSCRAGRAQSFKGTGLSSNG